MSTEEKPKKNNYKKIAKWTGIIIASLFILLFVILVVVYFVLRSGTLTQTAVDKINPIASVFGVHISKLVSARIDLLGDIDIRGLALSWQDEQTGSANINANEIRLNYSLGKLLSSQLTINEILLKDISVKAQLKVQPAKKEQVETEAEPFNLSELEDILAEPPLPMTIKRLELRNINFDLVMNDASSQQAIKGTLDRLSTEAIWNEQIIFLTSKLEINPQANQQWFVSSTVENSQTNMQFIPHWNTDLKLALSHNQDIWNLADWGLNQQISLDDLSITNQVNGAEPSEISAKSININLETIEKTENKTQAKATGLEGLFPLSLNTLVTSNIDALRLNLQDEQGMRLQTVTSNNLHFSINNAIKAIEPISIVTDYSIINKLNLENFDFKDPAQSARLAKLNLDLNSQGSADVSNELIKNIKNNAQIQIKTTKLDYQQQATDDTQTSITAALLPEISLNSEVTLPTLDDINAALATITTNIALQDIDARIKSTQSNEHYKIKQNTIDSELKYQNKQAELKTNIDLLQASVPQLKKTVSLNNQLTLNSDIEAKQGSVNLVSRIEKETILGALINFTNTEKTLSLSHQIKLNLPLWLNDLNEAAEALAQIGHNNIELNGESQLRHNAANIQTANMDEIQNWPVKTQGKLQLVQLTKPTVADGVIIKDALKLGYNVNKDKQINTAIDLQTAGIQAGPLLKPMPLKLINSSQFTWPLSTTKTQGTLDINAENALDFDLTFIDKPNTFTLNGRIYAMENPQWQEYLADIKPAEDVGQLMLKFNPRIKVTHPAKTVLEFNAENPEAINADIAFDLEVAQSAKQRGKLVQINKPITLSQSALWKDKTLDANTKFYIGDIHLPDIASVSALPGSISLKTAGGIEPNSLTATIALQSGNISLHDPANPAVKMHLGKVATPLMLEMAADKTNDTIQIQEFALNAGQGLVQLVMEGVLGLNADFAQLRIQAASDMSANQLSELGFNAKGKFTMPLEINYANNADVSLNGSVNFDEFSIGNDAFQLEHLSGKMQINEELVSRNNFFAFKYLLDADPFQRVDFSRIQPYLDTSSILSFASIKSGDINVGPGMVSMAINQNLIQIQRMDLDALGGQVLAQFYMDARPGGQSFGLLSRISGVDPRVLLPESSPLKRAEAAPISARTAINFNLVERLMEGKIDVTEINKAQLLQLLEFVDPEHKDEQIESVRSALRFAFPQNLSVEMVSGLMNLEVKISALPEPIIVRGIPLTPLIQQSAGDIEKLLADLPIKDLNELNQEQP